MNKNIDFKLRDKLVGLENPDYSLGGTASFSNLSLDNLSKLIDLGYLELDESFNDAPTVEEFLEFMKEHPGFTAHGYVVSPDRSDTRISIEGIDYSGEKLSEYKDDFIDFARYADELDHRYSLYCWWD